MSNNIPFPQIYLSYSWKNSTIADAIIEDFNKIGISLMRDVRNLSYSKSFKDFTSRINKIDFVWIILSEDSFLCETCMFELTEMLKENTFKKKFLLIRAISIDDSNKDDKINQIKTFWKEKLIDTEEKCTQDLSTSNIELFIHYQTIIDEIDQLILKLYEPPYIDFESLKDTYYSFLLSKMEVEDKDIICKALAISALENKKEKETEIDTFLKQYPNNKYGLFLNALQEMSNQVYWKAKNFFQQLIEINHKDLLANQHLANILSNHFLDHAHAKKLLLYIERKYPFEASTYFQLGTLYEKHFSNHTTAKKYYEKAISVNPNHTDSLFSLGLMEETLFKNLDEAKYYYEKALASNATHINTLYRLGLILKEHFAQFRKAYDLFVKTIKLQPKHAEAHYQLAILYHHHFGVLSKAKKHYLLTISITPEIVDALYQLANLFTTHYKDYKKGRLYFEKTLITNPKNAEAHYSLAKILTTEFDEPKTARLHYDIAIKADKQFIDNDIDKQLGIRRRAKRIKTGISK